MKLPSFPNFIRTLYTLSNTTTRLGQSTLPSLSAFSTRAPLQRQLQMPNFLSSLFSTSQQKDMTQYPVQKTDAEWQTQLSPQQFKILREKGTEPGYTGEYDKHYPAKDGPGTYNCAGCDAPLYTAAQKFKSGCGWPAFFDAVPGAIVRHEDNTWGMQRIEIVCANCGGHLGHVFKGEGYATPTDERHCVNSISLRFAEDGKPKESKA